jgi:3'-5' exoribonuclease
MSAPRPPLSQLSELSDGQQADFFALLAEKTRGATSDGKPYWKCRFRDARRAAVFMAWGDEGNRWFEACQNEWQAGQFYKLRATYTVHERYGPQVEVHKLRPITEDDRADGFDEGQFVEASRHDLDHLLLELRTLAAKHVGDEPLRRLVLGLLETHGPALRRLPATRDRAYPYVGGLLEHTLSVARVAVDLVERYRAEYPDLRPPLNRDLVVAGAILHDLGRVRELGEEAPLPQPTVPGRLLGPLLLGRDLVRDAACAQGDVSVELLTLLEHVLLTPLTGPEGGAPRWPLIPEGLIVQHADELDLKMAMYARCLERDTSAGAFTERDPALGRALLRGRTV